MLGREAPSPNKNGCRGVFLESEPRELQLQH